MVSPSRRPLSLARRVPLYALVLAPTLMVFGCEVQGTGTPGRLSAPKKDQVRIVATKIAETPQALHWKWSLIGERNWGKASTGSEAGRDATGYALSLSEPSPLNDPRKSKGCNVWELDLTAEKIGETVRWKATLHGIDGTTVEQPGEEKAAVELGSVVKVRQNGDAQLSLPLSLAVAEIGGKPLTFQVAK